MTDYGRMKKKFLIVWEDCERVEWEIFLLQFSVEFLFVRKSQHGREFPFDLCFSFPTESRSFQLRHVSEVSSKNWWRGDG